MFLRRRSTFLVLLSIVPLVHLLNIKNEKSSKLKISPFYCQSPRHENITGICMLSLECKEKNGTVIGSCFNHYLMGACCHDPTYGVTTTTTIAPTILADNSTINSTAAILSAIASLNSNPISSTITNATLINSNANTTQSLHTNTTTTTTVKSPTLDFSSTTTRPFSKNATTVKNGAVGASSKIKGHNPTNNKSSSSVKRKPISTSTTTISTNEKIKPSSTEKYTSNNSNQTKGDSHSRNKTAPVSENKGKKKSSSHKSKNKKHKNKHHKTNSTMTTTMKTTRKPSKNTGAPTTASPKINSEKSTTEAMKTTAKLSTTTTTPTTSATKISPTITTGTTAQSTTTTVKTTTTTAKSTTTSAKTTTTAIPTTVEITTPSTTTPTITTTATTTTAIPTTVEITTPTTTTTTATTTTTKTTPTLTTKSTTPLSTSTGEIYHGGIMSHDDNNEPETTVLPIRPGNYESLYSHTKTDENGSHELYSSNEVEPNNDSSSESFSDEENAVLANLGNLQEVENFPEANSAVSVSTTVSTSTSTTESPKVILSSAATATTISSTTMMATATTTRPRPSHNNKKSKYKKKSSSKRQSATTTPTIPSTKRTTTEKTPPPEKIVHKIKKNKYTKKGTTEIPTFYITPTTKKRTGSGSTTEKPPVNFAISEEELETDIDDFINQVVQSLAESLDGSPLDESLKKQESNSDVKGASEKPSKDTGLFPNIRGRPSKKNATAERIWDYKKDCGIRPLVKSGRIVGGTPSKFGAWPWHALIKETTWWGIFSKVKCGGVLISHRFVLTAGHCKPTSGGTLTVALGVTNTETSDSTATIMNVRRFITHPRFNPKTYDNDIAIVELDRPVEYQPHIVPICMPSPNEVFEGKKAIVTGMGLLRHDGERPLNLHEVDVPILENEDCQQMFAVSGNPKPIRESFICAGYAHGRKDSCGGDSGGGLQLQRSSGQWVLAGTVSHGIKCALPNQPGVYMRMTYYKPWINRIIAMANRGRHDFFRPNPAMLGHPKTPASEGMLSDFILKLLKMIGRFWSSERIPD